MSILADIRFQAKVYVLYALQNLKVKMAYPWDFFTNMLGSFTYGVLNVLFLWVLLSKATDIVGWTFPELIFLYGFGEFCFGMFSIFFFHMTTSLSEHYIVEGYLDRLLVRPISPLLQLMMENLDMFDVVILLKGGVLMAWAWTQMTMPFDLAHLIALGVGLLIGSAVYLGVFLAVTSLSFWFPDRGGLLMPLFSMNDVSRYPLTIYPPGIRLFFSYLLPFAFAVFYPTVWVLEDGPLAWSILGQSVLAALACLIIGLGTFRAGVGRYESTGT
jgi:ABC-2 type transport system permease protein